MSGSWQGTDFPGLTDTNHKITSPASTRYNCIAWAAGDTQRKWWPDTGPIGHWPESVPREETTDAFVRAYGTLGFAVCLDGGLEEGIEKIALYGEGPAGVEVPTHAALQLASGQWTSKLGDFEDISHSTVEAVAGPCYGRVLCYLSRPRR